MDETINVPDRIRFTYKDREYVLEFDRASVAQAERRFGISVTEAMSGKITAMKDMFTAAFIKHHPKVKPSLVNEIFYSMNDKAGLYQTLVLMFADVANSVLEDDDQGNGTSWATE